jgi:hypothetical protein
VTTKRTPNFYLAALATPPNLLAVLAGALTSLAIGDWLPLAGAAASSLAYVTLVATTPRFRRAVRANLDAHALPELGAGGEDPLLRELSPSQRQHYELLRGVRDDILTRYQQMPGGRVLAASSSSRLDALLASFVRLVTTLNAYRTFLSATDRKALTEELRQLEAELAGDQSERLREVKARRVDLLKKRVQRYVQAEESREVVSHQLASIEDILRLTHEQSIAIRDPEGVGRQLEALTAEVAATEETVKEMEQFMQITEEYSTTASLPQPGTKVR